MVRETRHLWVGNLPYTIREERILEHFKRYGKVQSVKILPKKDEEGGTCATVAFIDIKSAAKAHNADNKIDERTLKTDYYEPPASSTASSAIYIHERDDALVRPAPTAYVAGRTPRYGIPEERTYERPGHYYERVAEREPYMRRPIGMGYHDEDNYQGRAKSRDRYSRSTSGNNYTEGADRNQNHFRTHNARQHFEQPRYPVTDQYNDEREAGSTTPRLNRRTNSTPATPLVVASVASPAPARTETRQKRTKRRSPSQTPSGSRSNSGSRSRSRSSSGSRSSSSSSKLHSSSSDSSGRSRSPSKSRSPAASYGSQSNAKGSRLDRPSSAIANPSGTVCFLPSAVSTPVINCSNLSQGSTPSLQSCTLAIVENNIVKDEKRPLGICVRNLPVRSTDTSLKDGLFHEYKKHGKVTMVKVIGQGTDRYAVVCFKKPEDVDKALEVSKDKLFFGCKIEVTAHEGLDAEDNEFRPLEAELDEFHPKATRTLFIGNLEKDITTVELRKHFDAFGEIIEIDIKKQGSATSYAFIQYSDIASVVKAMRKLDGENLGANRIKLGFGKSMPTNCVWLDGIVDTVSEKFLARHFSRFGIVAYTAVDREKGHALVFYESVEFAQIAVSEMRGRILGGKKLQVDFASRECQTTFFDKLEMTGQMVTTDGTRPWERRERRATEFEVVRSDEREARVGFENRVYPRYEAQARPARGNFRGNQRAAFAGRGRGQAFTARYETYHDEFGERRHRYNSRDESGSENSSFDGKVERKFSETPECPNRKRNKLRNSISDQESHHSQSPPHSRHHSRSASPKEKKPIKDRIHRVKSPGSQSSSLVNSPCRDSVDDLELNSDYRDFRSKVSDVKIELGDAMTDLSFPHVSPKNSFEKDVSEKIQSKAECDLVKSHPLDLDSPEEVVTNTDQLSQSERKKRPIATPASKCAKDTSPIVKQFPDKIKSKVSVSHPNSVKVNCVSDFPTEEVKNEVASVGSRDECTNQTPTQTESANTDLKYLQKKQVQILHLLEQLHESVNSSDTEGSLDCERHAHKKNRTLAACTEINSLCENDVSKSLTKDECSSNLLKTGIKEPAILERVKSKADGVDGNNCIALSLDSFIFRKHLDPRKGLDQHSVNSLQKCRRISMDSDSCLPTSQENSDSFICIPASVSSDVSWKKHCGSLNDLHFSDNDIGDAIAVSHYKVKSENLLEDDILNSKKTFVSNSSKLPVELQKSFATLRTLSDGLPSHEIKRERDISPLSLPLPKFAASLRSPKSSPSTLTSPKSTTAHSPRAGQSPSSCMSIKNSRVPDLLNEIHNDKKPNVVAEEKVNGANISPFNSTSSLESHNVSEVSETMPCMEPIQSPKSSCEKTKESNCSSESDFSPMSSPNRPSIEDRIKALDEKFNAWSGSTRTLNNVDATPAVATVVTATVETPKSQVKRSRFNFLAPDAKSEPSDIVKSLLAKSTIFDQDSKRLQHIDEKYEPVNVKTELSPKAKPAFRTKAAAKEFSTPIVAPIQTFNQTLLNKSTSSMLVAQGIMSPPATPQSAATSILSPVTPPLPHYTQLPPPLFTPCSPRSTSFSLSGGTFKNAENLTVEKDVPDHLLNSSHLYNAVKTKIEPSFTANATVQMCVQTLPKYAPATCPVEIPTQGLVLKSPPIKKEIISPPHNAVQTLCRTELDTKISMKKEITSSQLNIPIKKDYMTATVKDQTLFNHVNCTDVKKEFCESKDPRISLHEHNGSLWRENGSRETIKTNFETSAKSLSLTSSSIMDVTSLPITKKRVSSIDSNESDSSKSLKSFESSRDSHEMNWSKHDKVEKNSEPEAKKLKLSKHTGEPTMSPVQQPQKRVERKEKSSKIEKPRSSSDKEHSQTNSKKTTDKEHSDTKIRTKSDYREKSRSDHNSKEEKRSKSRESKDSNSRNEQRTKSKERQSSEKDNKGSHSSKNKKESSSSKSEKPKQEKKSSNKKSSSSKSKMKHDFQSFIEEEPVYFSMYDKVKARSSKSQTLKHQAKDLETMRQKFSKLKQSRAKREEKSKSADQDSDKDSDSYSHHSSESDSQAKSSKVKQQRKRKLVIESTSSDDDDLIHDIDSRTSKNEKDFSDSATDSDFEFNVSQRQAISNQCNKNRKKKTELFDTDSSDSESNFPSRSQSSIKKKMSNSRPKHRLEKSKKILKSDDELSDTETCNKVQNKEKEHKMKKPKKDRPHDLKSETDMTESDTHKKVSDEPKSSKKKSVKENKHESEMFFQKRQKSEPSSKEKLSTKDRKTDPHAEKSAVSSDMEKHRPYSKKRKKAKKISRNKEKRTSSEKEFSRKVQDESDTKSSLPILLSPKPSSPMPDKQLSPPCLEAGILSDNDFKSDFSDFEFHSQHNDSELLWKQLESKIDLNVDKNSKNRKKDSIYSSKLHSRAHSPEQDSSLPSYLDKLSDIVDSESGREPNDSIDDTFISANKKHSKDSNKKERDTLNEVCVQKGRHERSDHPNFSKPDPNKHCDSYSSAAREERRRKKCKKQNKEKRRKIKEETSISKTSTSNSGLSPSPKSVVFEPQHGDEDSHLSDIHLEGEMDDEAKCFNLKDSLFTTSEETNAFAQEGPAKREEKLIIERRFEEEAAKETRRLEAELFLTGRESWHMKDKEYDSEAHSGDLCDEKHINEMESMTVKDDNIFAGLDLHSSLAESSQNENDVFLSSRSDSDQYKIDDKDVSNDIEDQRKIEDDLAVSALLQEMHCGEISAPELTKETDYLDPIMDNHPEETMNYLLPDDGENSLHIDDNSPDMQEGESQEAKLQSSLLLLSPSSNSEPPALEISNIEDSVLMKIDGISQSCHTESVKHPASSEMNAENYHIPGYEFANGNSIETCESKPPVIDLPVMADKPEHSKDVLSPKQNPNKLYKKRPKDKSVRPQKHSLPGQANQETDDDESSDLAENQLSHFEDITMDTADSKDDDNPPILLPVESPPNLLPAPACVKEEVQPLTKVDDELNQILDSMDGKVQACSENLLDKVSDLDKQIGDIINSITELKKHADPLIPDNSNKGTLPFNVSNLSIQNSSDLLLTNSNSFFVDTKQDNLLKMSNTFEPPTIPNTPKILSKPEISKTAAEFNEFSGHEKFKFEKVNTSVSETAHSYYSGFLKSSCETSVIQSPCTNSNIIIPHPIKEKAKEQHVNSTTAPPTKIPSVLPATSEHFLMDMFELRKDKFSVIQSSSTIHDCKHVDSVEPYHKSELNLNFKDTCTNSPFEQIQQSHASSVFEIPEVNEQNEATEFNQEIFEHPTEQSKDHHLPRLLTFSSDQLFSSCTTEKLKEDIPNTPTHNLTHVEPKIQNSEKESVSSLTDRNIFNNIDSSNMLHVHLNEDNKIKDENQSKSDECMDIEDGFVDIKSKAIDAESVCSDATDITIPDMKTEAEMNQLTSSEEQLQDDVGADSQMNTKQKPERTRRGRKTKSKKHSDSAISDCVSQENQFNQMNTRNPSKRTGATSTERTRRSLRSDTAELSLQKESTESKHNSDIKNGEALHSENEELKATYGDDTIEGLTIDATVTSAVETDCSMTSNVSHGEAETKLSDKSKEEPRKRRGRKKKSSIEHQNYTISSNDKSEPKLDETEQSKDFHRPKKSRLWLSSSSEKEQKSSKDNASAYDVFEFRDNEDDDISFESVKDRLHDSNRNNTTVADQKNEVKPSDVPNEKEEKVEEHKVPAAVEDCESVSKEHTGEVNHNRKLAIKIRFLHKDGHDGTSPRTAEIVKTSDALNIEETKAEAIIKTEKVQSSKLDSSTVDSSYNGPCKSTRKSTRLMNQAARSTVDEVIEDVVKGNFKANSKSSELGLSRVTRRSRSSRQSEESLNTLPSENSEDTAENKNEPVFFIPDNAVKEVSENKKDVTNLPIESNPGADANVPEADKIPDRIASLRSYRITRSASSKLDSNKDNSTFPLGTSDQDVQKKPNASSSGEEKPDLPETKETVKETKITPIPENIINYRPPPPVLKVELPRMVISGTKEILSEVEKPAENEEDSDSRCSTAVLVDPVTGFLTPVNKSNVEPHPEAQNHSISNTETKTINSQHVSDLFSSSTSITNTKAPKPVSVGELSTVQSANQETPKNNQQNISESARSSRAKQLSSNSSQLPATASPFATPAMPENNLKVPSALDKNPEPIKLPVKKNPTCAVVGVVTMASSVISDASSNPVTSHSSGLQTTTVAFPSPAVVTVPGAPGTSSSSSVKLGDKDENSHIPMIPQTSRPGPTKPASFQPPVHAIVSSAAPVSSSDYSAPLPPKAQAKNSSSIVAVSAPVVVKSEAPATICSTSSHLTPHIEYTSTTPCKSSHMTATVSSDHTVNLSAKFDMHAPTSLATPVNSWAGLKTTIGEKIVAPDSHVSAVQSNPAAAIKSDMKSHISKSPHIHLGKSAPSYMQQAGYPVSGYETSVLANAHGLVSASNTSGGVIAELLQNPQLLQQHKEYFAATSGQLQERIQNQLVRSTTPVASGIPPDIAARLGNPTPPHTPTPPVTSSNHNQPSEMHPAHVSAGLHLRHANQPSLIVPPHASIGLHPSDINAFVHQQIIYHAAHPNYAAAMQHADLRAQQEAQARAAAALSMNSRFAYPPIPPSAMGANNFRQPIEPRLQHSSILDSKVDQKSLNELSKIMHEVRGNDEKNHHSLKSLRGKKEDKELKMMHSDGSEEHESRHMSSHEKMSSNAALSHGVNLRQQQHYPSTIRQLSPRLTVSPHERITDSPVIANLYASGQGRVSQMPISAQMDDHKSDNSKMVQQSHHYKGDLSDREIKPPLAHQSQPSTIPYHTLEAAYPTSRQQFGVSQINSPSTGHIDGRSSNPAHSPGSHGYKKESSHGQALPPSMHNPTNDKRLNQDLSKKVAHMRPLLHQGSTSPAPLGLSSSHSPALWPAVIQSHHSISQPPHPMMSSVDQPNRRSSSHLPPNMGAELQVHVPPPAHGMSQSTNMPRMLSQSPPPSGQVLPHSDAFIFQKYPVMWQGLLALKNDQAAVQMHFVSGSQKIARESLPSMIEGDVAPVRIAQRMRLEPTQLEGVSRKMQTMEEHCILMALPCGKDQVDVLQQSENLKHGFINYLNQKQAAGIVNAALPGTQQPAYVIHIFPPCDFSDNSLVRFAPVLLQRITNIAHLVIIIATV